MDLLTIKIIILFCIFVATLIFALLPFKFVKAISQSTTSNSSWKNQITELLNCFSGGVFLATTLLHLLPDVNESFEEIYNHYGADISYPLSELTVSVGLFMIVIIEHIIITLMKTCSSSTSNSSPDSGSTRPPVTSDGQSQCHNHASHTAQKALDSSSGEYQPLLESVDSLDPCDVPQIHSVRSFVLLLALSIHTVFEGLAIGLLKDQTSIWNLFAAVLIHKIVVAFSLGSQFAENITHRCKAILFMVLFSLISPIGIIIGLAITETGDAGFGSVMARALLQGIAAGTFLHVTFFEVLGKEMGTHKSFLKILVTIVGYALIAVVTIFNL